MTKIRATGVKIDRRQLLRATGAAAAFTAVPLRISAKQQSSVLPAGTALVSSLRLPLFDVGSSDVAGLLTGGVTRWDDVGSPVSIDVEPLALESFVPQGMTPAETFASYGDLADALMQRPGAVALAPADQVDFRANVLSIDGFDPVRDVEIEGELPIQIGVVGDIVPGRNVHNKMVEYGDFTHPFLEIAQQLSSYDLTFANMEGNVSDTIPVPDDPHTLSFMSNPAMLEGFKLAGIDAISLANNHSTWNNAGWGVDALLSTIDAIDSAELGRFGAGRNLPEARAPFVKSVNNKRIAVIGIDGVTANEVERPDYATVLETWAGGVEYAGATADEPGTNPYYIDDVLSDIQTLLVEYDMVIPYFHFGVEYVAVPPDWAVAGARAAIDAGAVAVVTNHPHVIQGMEEYAGRPIVYSVGNFIFDQMFSVEVRQGLILEMAIRGDAVVGLRCRGVEIEDFNQPRLMSSGEHASQMDRFWAATDRLAARE